MAEFQERRPFRRILFNAPARARQGAAGLSTHVLDISLKGVLLAWPDDQDIDWEQPLDVDIQLSDSATITMHARVAHRESGRLGLACLSIDLESVQHLRRLIELNLGDPEEMERELSEMILTHRA